MLKVYPTTIVILFFGCLCMSQSKKDTLVLNEVVLLSSSKKIPVVKTDYNPLIATALSPNDWINQAPGVYGFNRFNLAQDSRVSIRGFGARAAFGIRGIRVLIDGIPITTPDGQTQLDDLPLELVERVEILRGLSGSLYGNASGGVISFHTENVKEDFIRLQTIAGDYGYLNKGIIIHNKNEKSSYKLSVHQKKQDGYRAQSAFKNTSAYLQGKFRLNTSSNLRASIQFTDSPYAWDAGGLTYSEVIENPRQARSRNIQFLTKEKIQQGQISIQHDITTTQGLWHGYSFYSFRDFIGTLPFENGGSINLQRDFAGLGIRYSQNKNTIHWLLGVESMTQRDDRKRYQNLLGISGDLQLNQEEQFDSYSGLGLAEVPFGNLLLRTGFRFDIHHVGLVDYFLEDGSQSGSDWLRAWTPHLSIQQKINASSHVFVGFSSAFETPTLNEWSANPLGPGFNTSLDAQRSKSIDLGYSYKKNKTAIELHAFYTETKNSLIPYELENEPGRTFYQNLGKSLRAGLEAEMHLQIAEKWSANVIASHADYRVESSNNRLPSIPQTQGKLNINYQYKNWTLMLESQYIGSIYANDQNTVRTSPYRLVHFKFEKKMKLNHNQWVVQGGVDNLFNAFYYDNIRANAFGGRYYEPSAQRMGFVSLTLNL